MANYTQLINRINQYITTNGQGAITGQILNQVLQAMVATLGDGYQFIGVATPTTSPATPDANIFYLASVPGTYTYFNSIVVPKGVSILKYNGSWSIETLDLSAFNQVQANWNETNNQSPSYIQNKPTIPNPVVIDSQPTENSPNAVSSGGVYDAITEFAANVYPKSQTYSKVQLDSMVTTPDVSYVSVQATAQTTSVTDVLPASGSADTIYRVGKWNGLQYDESCYCQYAWDGSNYILLAVKFDNPDLETLPQRVKSVEDKTNDISVIREDPGTEQVMEFQTDNGIFIARITPDGLQAIDFRVKIGNAFVSISNIYTDPNDQDQQNFSIGDANGFNIVQFLRGHILTKNFNSAEVLHQIADLQTAIQHLIPTESLPGLRKNDFLKDFYAYKYGKYNSSWYERLRIVHFSDTHRNLTNLAEALGFSQGLVHLIVDTGDNANGVAATPATTTIAELQQYADTEASANTTHMPLLICNGNHDVPNLTKQQYFDIMSAIVAARIPSFSFGDAAHYRSYGYVDITPNATIGTVRVISLDPFDYDDGLFMNPYGQTGVGGWMNCVFSQTQIDWLIATLRSAANNGYKVITCMHYSWGDNTVFTDSGSANPDANYHQDPFMIPDIINAMQQRTTLNKSYPDDCNINNITVNEDFSNLANPLDFIVHLFGHIHSENQYQCQKTNGSQFYDILMIGAPNMGSEGYAINKVKLQPDTYQSIKCTALEIDTVEHTIYRVNYGGYKAFDMSVVERSKKIPYRFTI